MGIKALLAQQWRAAFGSSAAASYYDIVEFGSPPQGECTGSHTHSSDCDRPSTCHFCQPAIPAPPTHLNKFP